MDDNARRAVEQVTDALGALAEAFDRMAAATEAHTALLDAVHNGPRG